MTAARTWAVIGLTTAAMALSACTTSTDPTPPGGTVTTSSAGPPSPTTQAEAKAAIHADLDALVAAVGPVTEVKRDEALPCDPGNPQAGYAWSVTTVLQVDPTRTQETLQAAAQAMSARGYRVGQTPTTQEIDVSFRRSGFDVVLALTPGMTTAAVVASAPCLPQES